MSVWCEAKQFHTLSDGTSTASVPATRVVKFKAAYGSEETQCCDSCARSMHEDYGKWLYKNDRII